MNEYKTYLFDSKKPKDTPAYKLLLNSIKEKDFQVFFDFVFLLEFYKDQIFTKEFDEYIQDKPNNYTFLTTIEKGQLFQDNRSFSELIDFVRLRLDDLGQVRIRLQDLFSKYLTNPELDHHFPNDDPDSPHYDPDDEEYDYIKLKNNKILSQSYYDYYLKSDQDSNLSKRLKECQKTVLFLFNPHQITKQLQFNHTTIIFTTENKFQVLIQDFDSYQHITNKKSNIKFIIFKQIEDVHILLEQLYDSTKPTDEENEQKTEVAIDKVEIENYLTIKTAKLENLSDIKEIYFLGENGVGKTILLKSIISGLQNELIPEDHRVKNSKVIITLSPKRKKYSKIFAYGISRIHDSENLTKIAEHGFSTLFDREKALLNPVNWFQQVLLQEKFNSNAIKVEKVLRFFNEIINFEIDDDIDKDDELEIDKTQIKVTSTENKAFKIKQDGADFKFYEFDREVSFNHLADGYRSVLICLCDLLARLIKKIPTASELEELNGIVLIDEIDMLLHPKWEYKIVSMLRDKLPNIQWFFTTHSPMLILGASKEAVFYRLYKENGETKISEQFTFDQIGSLLANAIITSPLFGLDYSGMREQTTKTRPDIDTNDTYLLSRMNKFILQKSKESLKKQSYISPETFDKWILEAYELNQSGKL